jgi:hypothetical protein
MEKNQKAKKDDKKGREEQDPYSSLRAAIFHLASTQHFHLFVVPL